MSLHIAPTSLYVRIFAALIFLTGLTVGASYLDLGHAGNIALGLVIAVCKASLVALFFMHLKYDAKEDLSIRYFALFPLLLFCILVTASFPDIALRHGDARAEGRLEAAKEKAHLDEEAHKAAGGH